MSQAKEEALYDFLCTIDSENKPFESPYYWAAFCAIGQ
jgi:CHAT domain-containing protein